MYTAIQIVDISNICARFIAVNYICDLPSNGFILLFKEYFVACVFILKCFDYR